MEAGQTVEITLKSGQVPFKLSIGGYQIALLPGQTLTPLKLALKLALNAGISTSLVRISQNCSVEG